MNHWKATPAPVTVVNKWNLKKNEPLRSSGGQLKLTDKPDAINLELLLFISFTV